MIENSPALLANGDDGFGFLADGGPFLFVPWRRGQLGEILK